MWTHVRPMMFSETLTTLPRTLTALPLSSAFFDIISSMVCTFAKTATGLEEADGAA